MLHNRKKMALYEVIGKARLKSSYDKVLKQQHKIKPSKDEPIAADSTTDTPEAVTQWPKRPRIIQLINGRIEISVPYQLAVAIVLGLVLVVLVVFRLGQNMSRQQITDSGMSESMRNKTKPMAKSPVSVKEMSPVAKKIEPTGSKGNNRIVIQSCPARLQLEPVQKYFARYGMETEIREIGNTYFLVTADKYDNPQRAGTDGYVVRQKIIKLGAKYKAPAGYETFGAKPFHDAYGMRFDD